MDDRAPDVLRLEGITRDFGEGEARTRVLRGVDFALRRGEFAALMGPSGSGKSTLLHIMGLLGRPTAGRVLLDGKDTGAMGDDELTRYRGRTLGFVFQFHHLLPEFTALENVIIPMAADKGRLDASMPECGRALLERVGLGARADARANTLAGGHRPLPGHEPEGRARGRAHRQPRHPDGRRRVRAAAGGEPAAERHLPGG